jgi:hypothetical protein
MDTEYLSKNDIMYVLQSQGKTTVKYYLSDLQLLKVKNIGIKK